MQAAVGVQSSVNDLFIYYKALIEAFFDQTERNTTSTPNNPLRQVPMMLMAHISTTSEAADYENSYALAWARTELPTKLGHIGLNPTYVTMPTVRRGMKNKRLCIWYQGSTNTFLSSVFLLPDEQSGVVVLTNALANNHMVDWIGQLLLETLLDNPEPNNFLELAKISAQHSTARWPKITADLERERIPGTSPKPLINYVGKFYNKIHNFHLEIEHLDGNLTMCFQGNHEQRYVLKHYQQDVFQWVLTRDENALHGRLPVTWRAFYLLKFHTKEGSDEMTSLLWENDGAWDAGEIFTKESAGQTAAENSAKTEL